LLALEGSASDSMNIENSSLAPSHHATSGAAPDFPVGFELQDASASQQNR
jgi:hypothetical protein